LQELQKGAEARRSGAARLNGAGLRATSAPLAMRAFHHFGETVTTLVGFFVRLAGPRIVGRKKSKIVPTRARRLIFHRQIISR
jgi:hypothetical protein